DRAERFRLVHLAIAHECPDLAALGIENTAPLQVLHEARLVDRHQRSEPHRYRRELPEIGHQPRVRIRRQALATDFLPEMVELVFADAPFEKRAGVEAWRGVPLQIVQVTAVFFRRRMKEMVETDVVQSRSRSESRDMASD